jgi:hypothetical protein
MNTEDQQYSIGKPVNLESAVKALINVVPAFGGVMSSFVGDYQNHRKMLRVVEFIEGLREDFESHKKFVNEQYINHEDFLDILDQSIHKITSARQKYKRHAFRKIQSNSIINPDVDFDRTEEYFRILDLLQENHFVLLKILSDPIEYDRQIGSNIGQGGGFATSSGQLLQKLLPDWDRTQIKETCKELEDIGLVKDLSSGFGAIMTDQSINHLLNKLTEG